MKLINQIMKVFLQVNTVIIDSQLKNILIRIDCVTATKAPVPLNFDIVVDGHWIGQI